ncbi:MAG TPA: hypothetical protein VL860_14400 [Planctomycetota bacterium]|nr:hypothetical protein [Planctomycetota bacterium]
MILLLVLSSALLHSVWNVMVRATPDRDATIFNVALVSLVVAWLYFFAFEGMGPAVTTVGMLACVGAGFFEVFAFVALAKAYHAGPVGPAYAIARGAAPLMLLPFSMLWMGEAPHTGAVVAMLITAGGVLLLGRRKTSPVDPNAKSPAHTSGFTPAVAPLPRGSVPKFTALHQPRPVVYYAAAFIAAACIATFNGCYKICSLQHLGPAARYCVSLSLTLPFQLLFLRKHPPGSQEADLGLPAHATMPFRRIAEAFKKYPWQSIGGGTICAASFLLYLVALDLGGQAGPDGRTVGVSALTSLRTLSIPVAALIALTFLKEKLGARDWLGIAVITGGIVMLSIFSA